MATIILTILTIAGFNFTFWALMSLLRLVWEKIPHSQKKHRGRPVKAYTSSDVAAIIPAHNEEVSIGKTIQALMKIMPKKNIFVGSDNSTDRTVAIARSLGVEVINFKPNRGKAKVITSVIKHYHIFKRFAFILINDSDVIIDRNYFKRALPLFADKSIACIAPHGVTRWKNYGFWETFFIAYRIRLWRTIQFATRFGQTWRFTNVSYIVPGSLCLYRSSVYKKIKLDAEGLIIEDFNATFELHKKHLGKIAYSPSIFGLHQDPYTFSDYVKQIKRWNIGFWQTVKRNGIWPSLFWLATGSFMLELTLYSLFVIAIPFILVLFIAHAFNPIDIPFISQNFTIIDLAIGVFLIDYLTTIIAAIFERKPIMLLYGFFFFFLHYVDSVIHLYSIPIAFLTTSKGTWTSPERRK